LKHHTRTVASVICLTLFSCTLPLVTGYLMGQTSSGDSKAAKRISASSIQIEPTDSGDVSLPAEFRIAIYENLIAQIEKTGKFQHVYRSGDKDAATASDLVTLHTTARSFKEGSQKEREVTTVMGATSLTLNVHITDHAGQSIVDRDVKGKVLLMGENLGATYDFSKKVAKIVRDTF
jgi:hypothetical protein